MRNQKILFSQFGPQNCHQLYTSSRNTSWSPWSNENEKDVVIRHLFWTDNVR